MNFDRSSDLTGKVAVVTGGGGVLCSVLARALAQCGASVAVLDINLPAAEKVTNEIRTQGGKPLPFRLTCWTKGLCCPQLNGSPRPLDTLIS
jgi:NAD(P)-dependent dehydrogenase (short-subunit alcohol dehydrogenase family)